MDQPASQLSQRPNHLSLGLALALLAAGALVALCCGPGLTTLGKGRCKAPQPWNKAAFTYGIPGATLSVVGNAVDCQGDVYILGNTDTLITGSDMKNFYGDFFLLKIAPDGSQVWVVEDGASGASSKTIASALATDSTGDIYLTGYTNGVLDSQVSDGNVDMFVSRYSSSGQLAWTKQIWAPSGPVSGGETEGRGIVTDAMGDVFVASDTNGSYDGVHVPITPPGSYLLLQKYDPSGASIGVTQEAVTGSTGSPNALAFDYASNSVYVAGYSESASAVKEALLAKYDPGLNKQWIIYLGDGANDTFAMSVAVDSSGTPYFTGETATTGITSGGGTGNIQGSAGSQNVFLSKNDPNSGSTQWVVVDGPTGTSRTAEGYAVAVDPAGYVYVQGTTNGPLGTDVVQHNTGGFNFDWFLSKFDSSGDRLWTMQDGAGTSVGTVTPVSLILSTDAQGDIYAAGSSSNGNSSQPGIDGTVQSGSYDVFVKQLPAGLVPGVTP